jgi:cysteine desulfurase
MDNHATTPLDSRVLEAMMPYLTQDFGNPASTDHLYGARASDAVERSREQLAKTINASPHEIIFTSGATEADNLAIQGIARAHSTEGKHIITCTTEHKAVLDPLKHLESAGWKVTYVPVDSHGILDIDKLRSSITDDTVLISVMFANNEIGTIAPMAEIGSLAKKHGILFHTDAAQAVGHIPVDVQQLGIDLMSVSAHKAYGPKGIGALYVRSHKPRVKLSPILLGGGQERGMRSGTLNVPAIVGMGEAFEISRRELGGEAKRLVSWTQKMRNVFESSVGACINGHPSERLPHNLNVYFPGIESKALIQSVKSQVAISASSACTTEEVEPSHVILALGYKPERAHSSVRFGLGRFNTEQEVEFAIDCVLRGVQHLTRIGSVYNPIHMYAQ